MNRERGGRRRRGLIAAFAAVTDAVADALRDRGTDESQATLLAQVSVAVFRTAFERWTDQPDGIGLPRPHVSGNIDLSRFVRPGREGKHGRVPVRGHQVWEPVRRFLT